MAVEKVRDILRVSDREGHCAISFAAFNLESIRWVLQVAEEEQAPVILMEYPTYHATMPFSTFAATVKDLAAQVKIPVGLMLDHSASFDTTLAAVAGGFTSVMADYSSLPFEENVAHTREVVRCCHAMGIDVEGELGHVGFASNPEDFTDSSGFTDLQSARDYLAQTEADQLAVAIGTAHGNYVQTPCLDLKRLEELNAGIDTPLVLHGGSGVPDDQLLGAFQRGINKLNIATQYNQCLYDAVVQVIQKGGPATPRLSDCMKEAAPHAQNYIRHLIRLGLGKAE